MVNILVLQNVTPRMHLLIFPRSSLGLYLSSEYLFSLKSLKYVIPPRLEEIFNFLFKLLGNAFARHKIDTQCFYLCLLVSIFPNFLSSPPDLKKLFILFQAAFFKNLFYPTGKAREGTMQTITKFIKLKVEEKLF